jgi:hypothetical protein
MTPREVMDFAKNKGAKILDLRFMDFPGLWQHLSVPISELSDALFAGKRSGCENLTLASSSAHGVPCRYGHAPDLPTGPLGTDATRSARVYWNA